MATKTDSHKPYGKLVKGTVQTREGPATRDAIEQHGIVAWVTDRALLFEVDDYGKVWVPLSQICDESEITVEAEVGDEGTVTIPLWLWMRMELAPEREPS